jgi:tyrosinase
MRFSLTAAVAALAAVPHATASPDIDEWDLLAGKALVNQVLYQFTKPRYFESTCTPLNAAVRREWFVSVLVSLELSNRSHIGAH